MFLVPPPKRAEPAPQRSPHRHLPAEIATIFRHARRRRGWSYRAAAKELGIALGYVAMLDKGQRVPSTVVAEVLIEGYDLTDDEACLVRSVAIPHVGRDWRPPKGYVVSARRRSTAW